MLTCITCSGELGLRERYERLLDLLEAGLVVYHCNNQLEADANNQAKAQNVMQASVQMYEMLGKYWHDIPGDTVHEKLQNIEDKRKLGRDEEGNVIAFTKEDLEAKLEQQAKDEENGGLIL